MKKQLFISFCIFLFLISGTALVIIYGKGYQIQLLNGRPEIAGTGLMVLTSNPDSAQVFIDNKLITATNNTINLAPGKYRIKIFKQGYFPWQKTITVTKEVVSKADAFLMPSAPKLESITDSGIENPILDPSGTKIAYTVSSQSATRDGIYVLNMSAPVLLTLQSSSTQIVNDSTGAFSTAMLSWSPDGQNIVATVSGNLTGTHIARTYILNPASFTQTPAESTDTDALLTAWKTEAMTKATSQIQSLIPQLQDVVTRSFNILAWSPDETKILYTAKTNDTISAMITPPLIGADSTPEHRLIIPGHTYVYNVKEDKNYEIPAPGSLRWLADSRHLLSVNNGKIVVMEYDGLNRTTIYAGPFVDSIAYPWPDDSKIVILTNLGNSDITPNLYTIGLR